MSPGKLLTLPIEMILIDIIYTEKEHFSLSGGQGDQNLVGLIDWES
jgi:hypothetical protein